MKLLLRIKNKVCDEVGYFLEINQGTIWAVLFIIWLGFVLAE